MFGPRKVLYLIAAILGLPSLLSAQEQADASKEFVERLVEQVRRITIADLSAAQTHAEFRRLIHDGFAVDGIGRFVLGAHWRSISETDRAEYLTLFEEILVNVATRRFREAPDWRLEILAATAIPAPDGNEQSAIVRTRFWTSEASSPRLDWRVSSLRNVRRITDLQVDGISMAQTYREQFTSLARRQGVVALLAEMRRLRDSLDPRKRARLAPPVDQVPAMPPPVFALGAVDHIG